jgi:poly-D-alanine transfer protein DltD
MIFFFFFFTQKKKKNHFSPLLFVILFAQLLYFFPLSIIKKMFKRKHEKDETEDIVLKALRISSQEISEGIRKIHKDTIDTIYHNNLR